MFIYKIQWSERPELFFRSLDYIIKPSIRYLSYAWLIYVVRFSPFLKFCCLFQIICNIGICRTINSTLKLQLTFTQYYPDFDLISITLFTWKSLKKKHTSQLGELTILYWQNSSRLSLFVKSKVHTNNFSFKLWRFFHNKFVLK